MPGTYITTDDGGVAQSLSVPIAAALVSMKGHMKIRRLPNFVDNCLIGLFLNWKGMTHAHLCGIRHYCGPFPRCACFCAGMRIIGLPQGPASASGPMRPHRVQWHQPQTITPR
jgi:hypothetical protein